jgi:hypothetical protein
MADTPSLPAATSSPAANSPAAAPAADATPAPTGAPESNSASAAAAEPSSRPAAYEGSEPSLLQETAAKEPPKAEPSAAEKAAEAKPDAAAKPDPAKPADPKPAEPKPGDDAAKAAADAAAKPAAEPEKPAAPAPVEYKYELPESIKLADPLKAELHTVLDAFRADPANVQPLVDFYNTRVQEFSKEVAAHNRNVFNEMRAENRKAIMADPVLGGSGFATTSQAVARMRDLLVRKEFQQPRKFDDGRPRLSVLDEYLESTGGGDNIVMWDMLHNAARYLDEPQARDMPSNVRPPKDIGKPPGRGRLRDLYNNKNSNGQ